eukprot:scaffold3337_cov67-Phaeocystis_antarctica.AAC.1
MTTSAPPRAARADHSAPRAGSPAVNSAGRQATSRGRVELRSRWRRERLCVLGVVWQPGEVTQLRDGRGRGRRSGETLADEEDLCRVDARALGDVEQALADHAVHRPRRCQRRCLNAQHDPVGPLRWRWAGMAAQAATQKRELLEMRRRQDWRNGAVEQVHL